MIPIRGLRAPVRPAPPPEPRQRRKRCQINWTYEKETQLERMWEAGRTAGQIAIALGDEVSRNAVIGKARRMGLRRRSDPVVRERCAA